MKKNYLIGGLQIAMQALAEKTGINLIIGGDTACTNGKTIIIPVLPDDETAAILARGYIDHEAAHIAHTDFSYSVGEEWLNMLEDIRIEKVQGLKYPGVAINTHELVALLNREGNLMGESANYSPLRNLMIWAFMRMRLCVLKQTALSQRDKEMEEYCRNAFGNPFCNQYASLVDEIDLCQSTEDCQKLSLRIKELLLHPPLPPREKPKSKPNKDEGEGCGSDSSSKSDKDQSSDKGEKDGSASCSKSNKDKDQDADKGEDDGSASGSKSDKDQHKGNGSASGSKSDKDKGKGNRSDSGSKSDEDQGDGSEGAGAGSAPDREDQLKNLNSLKSDSGDAGTNTLSEVIQEAMNKMAIDTTSDMLYPAITVRQNKTSTRADFSEALRHTSRMRSELAGLFQSVKLKQRYASCVGHRIDNRSTHLVATQTPDLRVFASKRQMEGCNTALALLIDNSGSMHRKMSLATDSAYATSCAIDSLQGVPHVVGAFPGPNKINNTTTVIEVKPFAEKPRPEKFVLSADGGTPIAQVLLWAGMMLLHRPEERKIAIVFTDGDPDSEEAAELAFNILRGHGIEVYVIAMGSSYHANLWCDANYLTCINKIEELSKALINLLKQTLARKVA